MHVKDIKATVSRVKAVSVGVGGFIGRHKRASIAVGAALLLAGPLVTGDGELVFLNAVGLGFGVLLLRRFARPNGRQRTGRTQQAQRQQAARAQQARQTARATQTKEDTMTTQATTIGGTGTRPRPSLEELVDRLMAALFRAESETAVQTATLSMARSVHEARRLRQAGDIDGALAVFAGVDAAGAATTKEARWAYAEWTDLVRRRSGDGNVLVYSQGTGRAAALVPRDDGSLEVAAVLGMRWEPGKLVSRRSLRGLKPLNGGCVMVTANVDIPALKARHPLGDTVEASGVRLRGRGRVRQGVCPFHDEVEGSFTVYGDSERFYCFGCGEGGDVLDFVRRCREPEPAGGHRATGRQPRASAQGRCSSSGSAAPQVRRAAPEGPRLADGRGGGSTPVSSGAAPPPGSTWPRGASACPRQPAWALAMRRAAGCESPLSRTASPPTGSGTAGCSWSEAPSGSPE